MTTSSADELQGVFGPVQGETETQAQMRIMGMLAVTVEDNTQAVRQACTVDADPDASVRFIKSAPQMLTVPASGTVTFDMDGPKTGYMWTVRRIAVTDAAGVANSMGNAAAYVFAGQPVPSLALPGNLEWIISPLPNVANFGSDILNLQYGEHLLVQIQGGTTGENIICSVAYQLYRPTPGMGLVQV
jgi:hypothetical protein